MGCGKSTVGAITAKLFGLAFIDLDTYITSKTGKEISDIFSSNGEKYFRNLESAALAEMSSRKAVISCGGGVLVSAENAELMNKSGVTVFIDVPFEDCFERINKAEKDEMRPLNTGDKSDLQKLFEHRYPLYKKHAQFTIEAEKMSPMECAKEIQRVLLPTVKG
jgi:shikimate kinase